VVARKQATTANVDVGMVAGHLGRCGDLVDEHHRPGEVGTHEGLDELVAPTLPTGQVLQALGDRGVIQPCMAPPSRRMSGVIFALLTATEPT
jgi:hypothetical protein